MGGDLGPLDPGVYRPQLVQVRLGVEQVLETHPGVTRVILEASEGGDQCVSVHVWHV